MKFWAVNWQQGGGIMKLTAWQSHLSLKSLITNSFVYRDVVLWEVREVRAYFCVKKSCQNLLIQLIKNSKQKHFCFKLIRFGRVQELLQIKKDKSSVIMMVLLEIQPRQ